MFKKFCDAGCTFNGPQLVNSCKDTWKGLKNKETDRTGNSYSAGATCAAFHPTCDKNNNMIMRNQHNSELLNYKDINGTLLKNGCCSCGGGGALAEESLQECFRAHLSRIRAASGWRRGSWVAWGLGSWSGSGVVEALGCRSPSRTSCCTRWVGRKLWGGEGEG